MNFSEAATKFILWKRCSSVLTLFLSSDNLSIGNRQSSLSKKLSICVSLAQSNFAT